MLRAVHHVMSPHLISAAFSGPLSPVGLGDSSEKGLQIHSRVRLLRFPALLEWPSSASMAALRSSLSSTVGAPSSQSWSASSKTGAGITSAGRSVMWTRLVGTNSRLWRREEVATIGRLGNGLFRRMLHVPIGNAYGASHEKGERWPGLDALEIGDVAGQRKKSGRVMMAEEGVGGGGSKVFATVLRAVGESESKGLLRVRCLLCGGAKEGKAVCRESLGFLGVRTWVRGIAESMVPATWCRRSEISV